MTTPPLPPADPEVPALLPLLGEDAPGLLSSVVGMAGGALRTHRVSQVRYVPGRSVTVQYRCEVAWDGGRPRTETLVATAGVPVPEDTPVLAAGGLEVAVWRFPHDPLLPGLPAAANPRRTSEVLESLGAPPGTTRLRTRAYRAGRRAVIEASSESDRLFLKVLRPSRVAALQERHVALAEHLPVPPSYGWSESQGIVALGAMEGRTLRAALESGQERLPSAEAVMSLLARIPPMPDSPRVPGPHDRAPEHAAFLATVAPSLAPRLETIAAAVQSVAPEPEVPVHGDFHSSQVLIHGPTLVGMVDVDTVGAGERAGDLAGLLGHLAALPLTPSLRQRADRYGSELIAAFDRVTPPGDLRRRVAAVILGLATGPFRVQMPDWTAETDRRLDLAERWIQSAER